MPAKRLPTRCPYCDAALQVRAMACPVCNVEIHGAFRQILLHQLPTEDLEFLEQYLIADFSIKALEERSGMGYVAIRNRLDRLIEHYHALVSGEETKKKILDQVASGEITAAEAAERIARLG